MRGQTDRGDRIGVMDPRASEHWKLQAKPRELEDVNV